MASYKKYWDHKNIIVLSWRQITSWWNVVKKYAAHKMSYSTLDLHGRKKPGLTRVALQCIDRLNKQMNVLLNVVNAYTYIPLRMANNALQKNDTTIAMILKAILVPNKQLLLAYRAEAMQTVPVIIIQPPIHIPIESI